MTKFPTRSKQRTSSQFRTVLKIFCLLSVKMKEAVSLPVLTLKNDEKVSDRFFPKYITDEDLIKKLRRCKIRLPKVESAGPPPVNNLVVRNTASRMTAELSR